MKKAMASSWLNPSVVTLLAAVLASSATNDRRAAESEQSFVTRDEIGRCGGRLVISERTEPKTLNPAVALDSGSREIIGLINADLIHINRFTQKAEAALASSWTVSPDGRQYTLHLRRGLKFSDGQPFDADDVAFTFQVYLDERIHSPERDVLIISGKPIQLQKIDAYTLRFELQQPYAAADRLFDGIHILPRHLLKDSYDAGKITERWQLTTAAAQIAGLGPFRLKDYVAGQHITLERNPHYWKKDLSGNRLPYFDELIAVFTGNPDTEAMRFQQGEIDIVNRISASTFAILQKHQEKGRFRLYDLGPSLEYNFLFFNLNDVHSGNGSPGIRERSWFHQLAFRKAVSVAIDREAIARLAYHGRAYPLSTHVTPGNPLWLNKSIPQPRRSVADGRHILEEAKFSWKPNGRLVDEHGDAVSFSILVNAGNPQHTEIATLIQADLEEIGVDVKIVPLEFHALLNRVFQTYEYGAAIMALSSGDTDPNSEMNVLTSDGSTHVWNLTRNGAQMPWEKEIDQLMQQQVITLDYVRRKRMYDRVQQLMWDNLPIICLVSPNVLLAASERVGNFHPAILSDYALWNAEELFSRR